ncbi:hypothetical protein D3C73_1187240 [compost metagenome]
MVRYGAASWSFAIVGTMAWQIRYAARNHSCTPAPAAITASKPAGTPAAVALHKAMARKMYNATVGRTSRSTRFLR